MSEKIKTFTSVIVPVFNEAPRIVENLDLLTSEVEDVFESFEIIVVSDGSTDGTNLAIFQFKYPGLRVVINPRNAGKGAAVRAGFQQARGDLIFFIDGGMELHPRELRIFAGLQDLYQVDIVIGSKRHPQSQIHYPLMRRFLSRIYQELIRILFDLNATDTQVGLKLFRREVILAILPDLEINRYGFDLEILSLARLRGFSKILEAPIQMDYFSRNTRSFNLEFIHIVRVGWSLLKDTWELYKKIETLKRRDKKS